MSGGCAVAIIVAILLVIGAAKVASNEASKNNPPASCQLFGGNWTIWGGWSCG